ncbi:DUF84 family protein [Virgibacillus sp. W0181]|uniref:DUF84 family protein n=1 Tax=Virgibacillus sp. W0181 TaxID=3391581 RepID=UPI003F484313
MRITIGSKNKAKIQAVQSTFPSANLRSLNVSSHVSPQPFSDAETRLGAINRGMECIKDWPGTVGIGLEGGVMYVENELFLCNWGALVTSDEKVFTASGARIVLPVEIKHQLQAGFELGEVMDMYAKQKEVRQKEGAIGIFTNNEISRQEMFSHVVRLLKGQWLFAQK